MEKISKTHVKFKRKREEPTIDEKITKLVENITHTGEIALNSDLLKELKTLCRNEPKCIETAYNAILKYLRKKHSEVRLSSFQLCIELFKRAHSFRRLVIENLEEIVDLCVGLDDHKLPPPKHAAVKVKQLALLTIPQWKNEFGKSYKRLLIGYDYLVRTKLVDFDGTLRNIAQAEEAKLAKDRRDEEIKLQVVKELEDSFKEKQPLFEETIETITNCISLLLPTPDDFFVASLEDNDIPTTQEDAFTDEYDASNNLRLHGVNHNYNLVINIDPNKKLNIERSAENSAVIDNLKENLKLVKKRLDPILKKWEVSVGNIQLENGHELVGNIQNLKKRLENCVRKSRDLRLDGGNESSTDDDDMEEVTKEGYEPSVLPIVSNPHPYFSSEISTPGTSGLNSLKNVSGSFTFNSKCENAVVNNANREVVAKTTKQIDNKIVESKRESCSKMESSQNGSTSPEPNQYDDKNTASRKERLLALAPKLPYDVDLYHWEDDQVKAPTVLTVKVDKWGSGDMEIDEVTLPESELSLRTRVIEFTGQFERVTRSCRAPMPSGELCARMDRFKCPFHGKIVPRNDSGRCVDAADEPKPSTSKAEPVPEWQDPTLLAQLKAMTGIDLKMPAKKGTTRRKGCTRNRFSGLTDINKLKDNAKFRLKKKLFNKATLRRVSSAINKVERGRHRDKFGDQFNYQ